MIWISLSAGILYLALISLFLLGWERLKKFTPGTNDPQFLLSVIVPMRNEEISIGLLLSDINRQIYPSRYIEVIVVDDHSDDRSCQEAAKFLSDSIRLLSLPEHKSGKKAALLMGIENSHGGVIVTTDADCRVPHTWLSTIASYFEKYSPSLLLSPVCGITNSFFDEIQELEILSLQGSTAGSAGIHHPVMSNGANLSFSKNMYWEICHLYDEKKIHSGDDMFLLHELKRRYPNRIHFLKSIQATVFTKLAPDLPSFFRQRKRWTSKARFYTDFDTIITALIVFGINATLLSTIIYGIISGSFFPLFVLFFTKSAIDFLFLFRITLFFHQKRLMWWFPIVQSFYFLYICFTVFTAFFSPSLWKNRKIKY
jgi:glycosyltransferase involved in cell wall biosynthesis